MKEKQTSDLNTTSSQCDRMSPTIGGRSRVKARYGGLATSSQGSAPIQMKGGAADQSNSVHRVANSAFAGSAGSLPFAAKIQQAFGSHDVGGISAYQDTAARGATAELGTAAFASGSKVAFGRSPDLHTAAHEAAHVVQQRSGVEIAGGVGSPGDHYEQHADRVADAVVSGASAEPLLNSFASRSGGVAEPAIQAAGGLVEQPAPSEGGQSYAGAVGEKAFTPEEQMWIDDVLADPVISVVFNSYSDIPVGTLHKVKEISAGSVTNGQFSPDTDEIAISDNIYENKESHGTGADFFQESDEETFKGTLLHELFHFLEDNANAVEADVSVLPKDLVDTLRHPAKLSYGNFAFGWFWHPDLEFWVHFDLQKPRILYGDDPVLEDGRKVSVVMEEETWENSPMPVSGGKIDPEEDLAESFSMVMTSQRKQAAFAKKYPLRFDLLNKYVLSLQIAAKKRTGAP